MALPFYLPTPRSGYVCYCAQEMEPIAAQTKFHFEKRTNNIPFDLLKVRWGVFDDETENSEFLEIHKVDRRHVVFLCSFSSQKEQLRQFRALYVLCRRAIKSLTILLPFSPTATMERIDAKSEGVIATADCDAHFFSTLPTSFGGQVKLIIYDLHTLHNRFYFHDSVVPALTSAQSILQKELAKYKEKNYNIAFPDEGAFKRFAQFFPDYPEPVVCGKTRVEDEPNKRIVKIIEGDVKGRHCVIIDDLVRSGGTLIECQKALMLAGATAVSAFCTHAIFPLNTWKKFTDGPQVFENFWITNTNPLVASLLEGKKPFVVLDISEHFSSLI